jgi:hypothetical protein
MTRNFRSNIQSELGQDELIVQRDELMRQKQENLDKLNELRHLLDQMRGSPAAFTAPKRHATTLAELRKCGQLDQKLGIDLGNVTRKLKEYAWEVDHRRTFGDCFIAVARHKLSSEMLDQIEAGARELHAIWKQEQLTEIQKFDRERRFWEGYLRTAEQKGHDQPIDRQAARMLNRKRISPIPRQSN